MGVYALTGDIAAARITNALNASGSSPVYACRAWVNFNGTGTVAIRASGNVSSITDNGVGDFTINFTTAMPDANYCVTFGTTASSGESRLYNYACIAYDDFGAGTVPSTTALRIRTGSTGSSVTSADYRDVPYQYVAIFR
jgi:hypothetical protein